jgi:hypothetical protein
LNYYSQWLVNSVGVYPPAVWDKLWTSNGRKIFRHYEGMIQMLPQVIGMLFKNSAAKLFQPSFFETRDAGALGTRMKIVAPVLKFPEGKVTLGFNVSTRGDGVDQARWPEDLMVEIVQ